MKNLKLYEEYESENELNNDQDFEVDMEFHEYISEWEKKHAIPMTKSELEIQFSKDEIEKILQSGGDVDDLLKNLPNESILPEFINKIKSKYDWYNDSLSLSVLEKIWDMITDHEDPEQIDWSQDDEDYIAAVGSEDEDSENDLEKFRQISYAKYAKEDEIKKRKDEIFNKVADGIPLTDEELDFWKKNEKFKMKNLKKFNNFRYL